MILNACFQGRTGKLEDFGWHLEPEAPFASLLAEAFGWGLDLSHLALLSKGIASPQRVAKLRRMWREEVVARFVAAYGIGV